MAGLIATSEGAAIAWTVGTVTDLNDVSINGTLVEAFNAAGTGVLSDPEVNGVTFTGTGALLPGNVDATAFASGDTGSASYNALLSTLDFGGGTSTSISVGGGGLSLGSTYEIQIWYNQTNANNRFMDFGDGLGSVAKVDGNVVNVVDSPQAFGQFATGTFVADGTSQTITLVPDGMGNAQLNAYQVRQIPEPSSTAILACALGSLMMVRRRKNAE